MLNALDKGVGAIRMQEVRLIYCFSLSLHDGDYPLDPNIFNEFQNKCTESHEIRKELQTLDPKSTKFSMTLPPGFTTQVIFLQKFDRSLHPTLLQNPIIEGCTALYNMPVLPTYIKQFEKLLIGLTGRRCSFYQFMSTLPNFQAVKFIWKSITLIKLQHSMLSCLD
ncbi:hypothetical protein ROZALSC1DRAFT_23935 [Rozella allomycis CSF55]|uniref:HECT domain-containing protein n=1 Tax=Rozella allomycis (strain CSF55) TaxID=988480 RepID=A0A4P9YEZ4_ROZAC|nr:hypothetical protein ROZALSC1DRAFT_23935 [Rozella allomycis CSF55]